MRSITSGGCTGSSARAHGSTRLGVGRPRDLRRHRPGGAQRPGRTLALAALWQRLNFLPLPHQHGSFALSTPWRVERSVTATKAIGATHGSMPPLDPLPPVAVEVDRAPAGADAAGRAAAHRRRPSTTAARRRCSCTCGPTRPRAGRSARSSREPDLRARSSPTPRSLALRDHLVPRALARARSATPWPSGPRLDAVRGHPMASGGAWSWPCSTPSSGPPAARWPPGSARPRPRCAPGAALGLHDDVDDLLAEADAALRGRRGAAAGEDRARPRRRAAASAARPRRSGRDPPGRRQRLLHARTTRELDAPRRGRARLPRAAARRPTTCSGHARLAARARHPDLPRRAAHLARRDRGGRSRSAPARSCASSRPGSAAGSPPAPCTIAAPSSACRCGSAGCSRPASAGPRTWPSPPCPHMALPPDLDPRGRFDPDLADPRLARSTARCRCPPARHRCASPTPEALARRRGRGSLGPVSALPVTIDDVRAAAERIAGAVERTPSARSHTLSEVLGTGDRREVREPAVHRGVQGARRAQQAARRSPRTSGAAGSSPCRPATTPRRWLATPPASASRPPS